MRATFRLVDVDEQAAELRLDATIGEFRELRETLTTKHPSWLFGKMIDDLIRRAESRFVAEGESDGRG